MVENTRFYSIPLASRLDRLESIMNYLEEKENLSGWTSRSLVVGRAERECKPLKMAMRESYLKGSVLDRVASLEDRLARLCLAMESCNKPDSDVKKYGLRSKRVTACSLSTFNNPQRGVHTNTLKIQGKPNRLQQKGKQPSKMKQQHGNKDDTKAKSGKNGVPPSWPHLRILGC